MQGYAVCVCVSGAPWQELIRQDPYQASGSLCHRMSGHGHFRSYTPGRFGSRIYKVKGILRQTCQIEVSWAIDMPGQEHFGQQALGQEAFLGQWLSASGFWSHRLYK